MKKWTFLIIIQLYINAQMTIWTSTWIFGTYHIWVSADTVGLNSGLSLNLHLFLVYGSSDDSGKSTHLHMLNWASIV